MTLIIPIPTYLQHVHVCVKCSPPGQAAGEVLAKLDDAPVLPVMNTFKRSRMGEAHLQG